MSNNTPGRSLPALAGKVLAEPLTINSCIERAAVANEMPMGRVFCCMTGARRLQVE
jgi:hypothetical protein